MRQEPGASGFHTPQSMPACRLARMGTRLQLIAAQRQHQVEQLRRAEVHARLRGGWTASVSARSVT